MKKFYKIAFKAGVSKKEVKNITNYTFAGLITLLFSFLSSCYKNGEILNKEDKKTKFDDIKVSTDTNVPDNIISDKDNCGPTPGYPCGTKYYTVSIKDMKNTARSL